MSLAKRFNLRPDEHVIAIVRRSAFAYLTPAALAFLCVFLAFFLIVPLFARGWFGTAVFAFLLTLGVAMAFRACWFWYWTAFVVTSTRIIDCDQRGVFHRRVSEASFEKVEDVTVEVRGIIPTVFRLGTIRVATTGAQAVLELRMVPRPALVHELLGRLQLEAGGRRATPAPLSDLTRCSTAMLTQWRERIDVELARRRTDAAPSP